MQEDRWAGYKNYDHKFNIQVPGDYERFIAEIDESISLVNHRIVSKGKIDYYNIPNSFDIETYSSYYHNRKFANMYIWQLGINGSSIYGRTWTEYIDLLEKLAVHFNTSVNRRLIIYVHNLSYEFQFMRKWIDWEIDPKGQAVVFSLKERRPIYALAKSGIEFRCSYILSNYALSYIGAKLLLKYPVSKKVGDLDYNVPRNSKTVLTDTELSYCISDIQVVMSYIQEQIEQYGGINNLPLTNTGRVRHFVHNFVTSDRVKRAKYYDLMTTLQLTSRQEYDVLKSAFTGGFTHANAIYVGEPIKDPMTCWDLASSYPAVMCSRYFPMSRAKFVGQPTDEEFQQYLNTKCCLFKLTLYDVTCRFDYDGYISEARCTNKTNVIINNGRLMSADKCTLVVTELDFHIISQVYNFSPDFKVESMYIYERGYLPKDLILAILHLYGNKTSLKDIEDKIVEYMVSKNMINSSYGMIVTDIIRPEVIYGDGRWDSDDPDAFKQLNSYNSSFTRFLFYPWGVWVTAHARHNLWEAIFEFGEDYVYADTDSIKGLNGDKHRKFFEDYNRRQLNSLCKMCMFYGIPLSKVQPKTKKGKKKTLGIWEEEEGYAMFKTLGAKRYAFEHIEHHDFNIVVAGVNKSTAVPYLLSKFCGFDLELCKTAYSNDPNREEEAKKAMKLVVDQHINGKSYKGAFDKFKISLEIPEEFCGKMTHSYIDQKRCAYVTDLQGHTELCFERSCTHLEPASYKFSISDAFFKFLKEGRYTISF